MSTKISESIDIQELEPSEHLSKIFGTHLSSNICPQNPEPSMPEEVQEIVDTSSATEGGGGRELLPLTGESVNVDTSAKDLLFKVGDEVEYTGKERKSLRGKKLVVCEVEGDVFWLKYSGYNFPSVKATAAELKRC